MSISCPYNLELPTHITENNVLMNILDEIYNRGLIEASVQTANAESPLARLVSALNKDLSSKHLLGRTANRRAASLAHLYGALSDLNTNERSAIIDENMKINQIFELVFGQNDWTEKLKLFTINMRPNLKKQL